MHRLRGTIRYPGYASRPPGRSSASRVRENRTHGLKGERGTGPANSGHRASDYQCQEAPARNRSPIVTVPTPRGRVDVMHQEMRGLRKGSGWRTFWLARRAGKQDWVQADTPQEAIRKATLLPPKKGAAWLDQAAADARKQLEEADVAGSGADSGEVR